MPRSKFAAWLAEPTSRVAIVGATGWVGQAFVAAVLEAEPDFPLGRLRLFSSKTRPVAIADRQFETEELGSQTTLGQGQWVVVHAGVIGGDARARNDRLLSDVLALSSRAEVCRLVAISSGAAGFADHAPPPKAAYARMKRDHEETADRWSIATGIPLLAPRIFNIGGPFITSAQNYALGDFIQRLARDGRLAIGAADPVFRSYVHVAEMARTLLDMAVDETEDGTPFDVGGARVVELGELAQEVARSLGMRDAEITRPAATGGGGDWYVGDGRRYQTALFKAGRTPAPLSAIIADTIEYLRVRADRKSPADT